MTASLQLIRSGGDEYGGCACTQSLRSLAATSYLIVKVTRMTCDLTPQKAKSGRLLPAMQSTLPAALGRGEQAADYQKQHACRLRHLAVGAASTAAGPGPDLHL